MLGSKFTKFLSFLKQQISFSSNFTSMFRVMRHDCILSTKGVYQSTNLVKFYVSSWKSEVLHLMGSFCPNHVHFQLKKYRRVISHDTEKWCKFEKTLTLWFQKLAWGIGWTFKNLKICTLMGSFCPKRDVAARKFQRNYVSCHMLFGLSTFWSPVKKNGF